MNKLLNKVKQVIAHLLAYLPSALPIGMTEFDEWAKSVLALTNLPDNDSTRFTLASIIPHQDKGAFLTPKIKFAHLMLKAASNQIAFGVMEELKAKQLAAAAAKQAEATAPNGASIAEQIQQA
jgi:hypothetical protein